MTSLRSFFVLAAVAAFSATLAACAGTQTGQSSLNLLPSAPVRFAQTAGSAPALTISGTVISADIHKFTIKTTSPNCGTMYAYYSKSSTKFYPYLGYAVKAGMPIQVTGSGACANGGSLNATTVTYTAAATPPPIAAASTASSVPSTLTISGTVVSADVQKFTIKTTSPNCGTMYAYYSKSSTKFYPYLGYPITAGMPIQATGTGACANGGSLTAASVTYTAAATPPPAAATPAPALPSAAPAAPSTLTIDGSVISADVNKFTIRTVSPSCGTMYAYYSKSATKFTPYLGYPVKAGMPIQATGTGVCTNGGSLTASSITYTAASTAVGASAPTPAPTSAPAYVQPAATAFMPSSWGKISAFQVFDDTSNGFVPQSAAAADGWRYSTIWGARNNIGTSWLNSNSSLQTAYYDALETDASTTAWGAIGHTIAWWKSNHPDWVLYACTSSGSPTTTPAYVPGLPYNVPLDIHNPAAVDYQVRLIASYAHRLGYRALAIDEATFWQADEGVAGGYGCGIYQNGSFVRRYSGVDDPAWAADVVAWVKRAHAILTTDPVIASYHLQLVVNHPAGSLNANETAFLANVDADLDETGYSSYGHYQTGSPSSFLTRTNWAYYAQQHGVAVLMNDNWGSLAVTTPRLEYSIATYLMGNVQAESLFASSGNGYGVEQWHSQYQTAIGAPCGAYYGGSSTDPSNPSIYYRRFAGAVVAVNAGSGSASEVAHLPAGHTYTDLLGRPVSNPLSLASNDGYVLLTANGCR